MQERGARAHRGGCPLGLGGAAPVPSSPSAWEAAPALCVLRPGQLLILLQGSLPAGLPPPAAEGAPGEPLTPPPCSPSAGAPAPAAAACLRLSPWQVPEELCCVFDPAFSALEREVLSGLGFSVLSRNEVSTISVQERCPEHHAALGGVGSPGGEGLAGVPGLVTLLTGGKVPHWGAHHLLHDPLWESPLQQPAVEQLVSRGLVQNGHHRQQFQGD